MIITVVFVIVSCALFIAFPYSCIPVDFKEYYFLRIGNDYYFQTNYQAERIEALIYAAELCDDNFFQETINSKRN